MAKIFQSIYECCVLFVEIWRANVPIRFTRIVKNINKGNVVEPMLINPYGKLQGESEEAKAVKWLDVSSHSKLPASKLLGLSTNCRESRYIRIDETQNFCPELSISLIFLCFGKNVSSQLSKCTVFKKRVYQRTGAFSLCRTNC